MRLATVSIDGEQRIAAVMNDMYIDLNKACELLFESKGQARAKQIAEAYIPPNMIDFYKVEKKVRTLQKKALNSFKIKIFQML